jgi:hypothetical protein
MERAVAARTVAERGSCQCRQYHYNQILKRVSVKLAYAEIVANRQQQATRFQQAIDLTLILLSFFIDRRSAGKGPATVADHAGAPSSISRQAPTGNAGNFPDDPHVR